MVQSLEISNKKDKRMLVLLAFGVMITFFRVYNLMPMQEQTNRQWLWLEMNGNPYQLYRFTLLHKGKISTQDSDEFFNYIPEIAFTPSYLVTLFEQYKAIIIRINGDNSEISAKISPRLSFLLGLPFPINEANDDELTMLPGIGPTLAAHISAYRESRGSIPDKHALRSVEGIGKRLAARLAPYLSFE